ncbi:hypothetical protein ABW19_dt0201026 [Dactylella cylindrospora]|nr:hypothetical protein ABW19_dt0201026 [Dactylella cylindrospora]
MHLAFLSSIGLLVAGSPLVWSSALPTVLIDHSPPSSFEISPLQERDIPVCSAIKAFVSLLKANKATPFCSEFLNIQTVSIPFTETTQAYTTSTSTIETTVTTTVAAATEVLSLQETRVVLTLPTTVVTSTIPAQYLSTIYVTPTPVVVTSTQYYTSTAVKARDVELDERGVNIPLFLRGFAGSAISKGCSCLDIPTPSVTFTATATQSHTIQTQITEIKTNTHYVTVTTRTTATVPATSYAPVTALTTSTSTVFTTSTLPASTITSTFSIPFRPQCTGLLAKKKLVQWVATNGRRGAYSPRNDFALPGNGADEITHSICCESAYKTPDALYFA